LITSQVTLATFLRFGSPDPDFSFAASNNWTAAGVLTTKSNDLSLYSNLYWAYFAGLSWVLALNCLQNSWCYPSSSLGPTGGDGCSTSLTCSLTTLLISLAIF
jgi:hypothetical protein